MLLKIDYFLNIENIQAYVESFILRAFYDGVRKASEYQSFALIFEQLFHVFAIHTLRNQATDFIRVRYIIKFLNLVIILVKITYI